MWKTIPGYARYEINVNGTVKSKRTKIELLPVISRVSGKKRVYINGDKLSVYRLIAKAYIGAESTCKANVIEGANKYLATTEGRIYTLYRNRYLRPGIDSRGYESVSLTLDNGKVTTFSVHRLVALALISRDDDDDNVVNHIDHNKLNNYIRNLEWTTYGGNSRAYRDYILYHPKTPSSQSIERSMRYVTSPATKIVRIETDKFYIPHRR